MKIKDAISSGKIPKIRIEDIFKILDNLGIRVSQSSRTDEYDLDEKVIDAVRQVANAVINYFNYTTEVNKDIKTTHNDLMKKYDSYIEKYKAILGDMQKDPSKPIDLSNLNPNDFQSYFVGDIQNIKNQIDKLEQAKKGYENVINGINLSSDNLGFDENVLNNLESAVLDSTSKKIGTTEVAIQEYQEQLDKLNSLKVTSKFKQKRINRKKKRIEERLSKLKSKRGKLQTRQTRIVNKGSNIYIKIKEKEFEQIMRESERISSYQTAMSENQRLQEGISNDIVSTKEELDALKGKTGIKATIERSVLERENRRLEKRQERLEKQQHRINNLKNKKGYCNLSNQILRGYTTAYAM